MVTLGRCSPSDDTDSPNRVFDIVVNKRGDFQSCHLYFTNKR